MSYVKDTLKNHPDCRIVAQEAQTPGAYVHS